jgi:serine kinase of HPr protein (carbohydrate metabolism regulator)
MMQLHATCVDIGGTGLLLRGPSGSGKSDLALRLIDGGARLVADDRVILEEVAGRLMASGPRRLAGLLEVRGVGILPVPHSERVELGLIVDLVAADAVERLPEPDVVSLLGIPVRRLALWPFAASAPAALRLAASRTACGAPFLPDLLAAAGRC